MGHEKMAAHIGVEPMITNSLPALANWMRERVIEVDVALCQLSYTPLRAWRDSNPRPPDLQSDNPLLPARAFLVGAERFELSLSRLSSVRFWPAKLSARMVIAPGIEPGASAVSGRRSSR